MAIKSVLTIATDAGAAAAQLDAAIALARREDAHLDVLCIGIDRTQTAFYYGGATVILTQEAFDQAREDAAATEVAVRQRLAAEDIRWSAESAIAQVGALGVPVALRARYADIVVLAKPYGPAGGPAAEAILEAALFEGRAPVLVLPEGYTGAEFGKRVVVAWNERDEALTAVRAALPLLVRASSVNVTVIDPSAHGPERSDPGGMLSQFLARHGVTAEISVLARTLPKTSEVLTRHAGDVAADLIVMGAYGHSRFRQAILGGTTRNMLETTRVPIFMAH